MNTLEEALNDLKQGRFIILVDDEKRENEGDLVISAEKITPDAINFMTKMGRGLICMPLAPSEADRLQLPLMVTSNENQSKYNTPFTVSIGAATGVTTGISAHDRARTVQVAADPCSTPNDIVTPGHIFPLRAHPTGVLGRAGHTEGSVDLMKLAGLQPAAVLCEILKEDGTLARLPDLKKIAEQHQIKIIAIDDLIAYRMRHERLVRETATARLPVKTYGNFTLKIFETTFDDQHVVVLHSAGKKSGASKKNEPTLVRIHSECLTGDIFGSARCDCGWQLDTSLARISAEGGVLLYLRQEGRGIGIINKIKAYQLQDERGLDTVEANHELGFEADRRDYGIAGQILRYLGINQIRLLTNNPTKIAAMQKYGMESVIREAIQMPPTTENQNYLSVKRDKMGHLLWE
ncbi:MAG: 3,4-dihydroxy-2-butanone-4-phosphate synthase [Gammaproteobacteria bacterium]